MRNLGLLSAILCLVACADFPRDPERTEAQVREGGTIRLGWVTGAPAEPGTQDALSRIERITGARAQRLEGDSETLLSKLEEGKIDLVYGSFPMDSPWAKKVHFGKAVGWRSEPPKHVSAPRFAYRTGENGWIMLVEREVSAP